MPKINVYLPDELAQAVKESGVPVSAICQRALDQAVRRITAIRSAALADLTREDLAATFPNVTARARDAIAHAVEAAASAARPWPAPATCSPGSSPRRATWPCASWS
ncbi:type II toxin-antitoxin system CcdA family antitoxin [Actinomadura sp. J1-007]|uniref:type II toxin-antitoxin system CcdA family antitoxin n=1 Tax=Actinomadura sp. J1-007 TaxID=2661913 RepID=UPI001F4FF296|nr:type II toxin-antitoxin system CcdA family antitoxin [Actinomadura sp. J1-007]